MARIAALAAFVAMTVLAMARPSLAESAGELRVAERVMIVTAAQPAARISIAQPAGYRIVRPMDDRDVRGR